MKTLEQLAREAHDLYERLAPEFGYETRTDTRQFDPQSANGRLMMAVYAHIRAACRAEALEEAAQDKADAERYRYIRNRPQSLCFMNTAQALGLDLRNVYVQRPEQLDAVIDAAIREMK